MKRKKIVLAIGIALSISVISSGCFRNINTINTSELIYESFSSEEPSETESVTWNPPENTETESFSEEPENTSSVDADAQLQMMADSFDDWKADFEELAYSTDQTLLAVTDLNRNGRLELILSNCMGSGAFSTTVVYEVDEAYSSLERLNVNGKPEADQLGDFVSFETFSCYKKNDVYYYGVEDYTSTGWAMKGNFLYSYSFDGEVKSEVIGGYTLQPDSDYESDVVYVELYDKDDNHLADEESFNENLNSYWDGYEKQPNVAVSWQFFPDKTECLKTLQESYDGYDENVSKNDFKMTDFKLIYGEERTYQIEMDHPQ